MVGLADNFRALTDEELAILLSARPELTDPPPATMADLAQRASAPYSVQRCLQGQNALSIQLLHALVLLGSGANVGAIASLAEMAPDRDLIENELRRLRTLGLVTSNNSIYSVIGNVGRSVGRPFGLGDTLEHSFDRHGPNDLRVIAENLGISPVVGKVGLIRLVADHLRNLDRFVDLLKRLPISTVEMLTGVVKGGSSMVRVPGLMQRSRVGIEAAQLLSHGLLVPIDWDVAEVPREIALMMMNGHAIEAFQTQPSEIVGESKRPSVDEISPAVLVDHVARLLLLWGEQGAATLKAGGIGVTVLKSLAKDLGVDQAMAARIIALAGSAGLIATELVSSTARPTKQADHWFSLPGPNRYLTLIDGWRTHPVDFARYTMPDSGIAPLRHEYTGSAPWRRARMLAAMSLSAHTGFVDVVSLTQHVIWTGPSYWQTGEASAEDLVAGVLDDLYLFGLTRNGVLTEATKAIVDGDNAGALIALRESFPEAVDTFTVQADLTAIAPGELRTDIGAELAMLADVESRGGATLLRFSETSLRRAMDRGRTTDTILEFLTAHARPVVPQPLKFLIEDVGRRHGQLRMGSASTYLRADDPALLAAVVNHRKMAKGALRLIAPTVAISTMEEPKLLRLMRESGFLPMPELADGTVAPASQAPDREVFERDFGERGRSEGQRAWNEGLNAGDKRSQLIDPAAYKLAVRLKQR